jgi:hypothetical protein
VIEVSNVNHSINILISGGKIILEQLPGLAVSLIIAERYFRRQRRIDRNKEESDVKLHYGKVVDAFIIHLGKRPKNMSFELHEAMAELRIRLTIYRPEFDANKLLLEAAEEAKKRIAAHPEDFE